MFSKNKKLMLSTLIYLLVVFLFWNVETHWGITNKMPMNRVLRPVCEF